ncbi:riboflavin synthase [Alicyclobacillus dauci]|uniref:Riboflavin synthase n=1 Tax=Alicyclobacillus dauci TaxID=1475485 RepID=A0ABY6Z794_9BACL|nr:riboflavin synthase [Alicyclobacillus dauci]WAH37880.1 riboflavin synthase [Alicyclobacillus dauci]
MFTGLVEELATIRQIRVRSDGAEIELDAHRIMSDMNLGDSISVNGICLTVVRMQGDAFLVEAVPETLRRTNLGRLSVGDKVHVERAMPAGGRFGGHIVSGHIDGTGRVSKVQEEGVARVFTIEAGADILKYIVEKGSICVDGVSLTVMDVDDRGFRVAIIPHTRGETRFGATKVGDVVNLECDVIAKYVERLLGFGQSAREPASALSFEFLQKNGFA